MKKNVFVFSAVLTALGLLTLTGTSHAALLAYDGFNYSAGNVNGDNGGTGWSGAWVSSTSPVYATVVTGTTLSYAGGSISVGGSGTALNITGGSDGALNRSFVGTASGSEIYFSFLFQAVAGSGDEFFHFYLGDSADRFNSGGIGDFYTAAGDTHFGARVNNGTTDTTTASSVSYTLGATYLLVGRLSTDGATGAAGEIDQVQLWVNPTSLTPGTASATVNASIGLTLAALDVFSTRTVNFAGTDQILIDELKIGTDFASVVTPVPEPSAAALATVGGMVVLFRRRKSATGRCANPK
jgi:hypothetical protein